MTTDTAHIPYSEDSILVVRGMNVDISVPAGTLHAVTNSAFHVKQGETLCIVGESGCGKSITSLAVMGLLPGNATVTADVLKFEGQDLLSMSQKQLSELRGNRMGMIFQDPMTSLNPVYTIGNQMQEIYVRHGKGNAGQAKDRAIYLLEKGRHYRRREPARPIPPSAFGGSASAGDDRHDADERPGSDHCR